MVKSREEIKKYQEEYRKNHKEERKIYDQKRYSENVEYFVEKNANYYLQNAEDRKNDGKEYYKNNKETAFKYNRVYIKKRRNNDVGFNLRSQISKRVAETLKNNNSSKNGKSIFDFLQYTMNELKEHLEAQFEPWMNWNNYGKYNSKVWDDNDSTTWIWNLDHIIPQSLLSYSSMEEDNFKKCWSLENLRPLSAKQNLLDGANKTRHTNGEL